MDFPYKILQQFSELKSGLKYEIKNISNGSWGTPIYYTPNQCRDKLDNIKHLITQRRLRVKNANYND
jgi:hypothetical protein